MSVELNLSDEDLLQLREKGISKNMLEAQVKRFKQGFKPLNVLAAAHEGEGVTRLTEEEKRGALEKWDEALLSPQFKVIKFVPASGAASRMFKSLYQYYHDGIETPSVTEVLDHIEEFAFADALNRACMLNEGGKTVAKLLNIPEGRHKVVGYLLEEPGLNYGHLPKALLLFHKYTEGSRTAVAEQMVESAKYAKNSTGTVALHFTLSPDHIAPFHNLLARQKQDLEDKLSVKFEISHSTQKSQTDTIAVDMENQLMREPDGSLMFRPGGHGALIKNLNELHADVIFIKNIDNIVPDYLSSDTVIYKKALGGYLLTLRDRIYKYLTLLINEKKSNATLLEEIWDFMKKHFAMPKPDLNEMTAEEQVALLTNHLYRPLRVCGMVRNEGEPGGGPYIVQNEDGTATLQILESTQIDMDNPEARRIFEESTFFNPVDLVCSVKDYRGQKFDLNLYVDEEAGFISHKSKEGKELKALELPGLWNGAMSRWLTAFVEVPATTFNPVKEVNDLLKPAHKQIKKQ